MSTEILFNPKNHAKRWLGYFDLLGTRKIIESGSYLHVFDVYARALEKSKRWQADSPTIHHVCFSDTFIIYSASASAQDFAYLDQVARWFVHKLIVNKIPVRGALSCDSFYADREHSLYFGPALVESYDYGEAQDWLGFILTPSAVLQAKEVGLPANERLNYAYWHIPYKNNNGKSLVNELPACVLGRWVSINGRNLCLDSLVEMKKAANQEIVSKYINTIDFIEKNRRVLVNPLKAADK